MTDIGVQPYADRVLIQADAEERAPETLASGILTATTLAAAVTGSDAQPSWFVGTIVAVGPEVQAFDCRPYVLKRLRELITSESYFCDCTSHRAVSVDSVGVLHEQVKKLPAHPPDCLKVGDRVTFSWASGQEIVIDGTKYLIMRASEVLGVIDADEAA